LVFPPSNITQTQNYANISLLDNRLLFRFPLFIPNLSYVSMDELRGINSRGLFRLLDQSDADFEEWMRDAGLLHRVRTCEHCGGSMSYKWKAGDLHPTWRCNKGACRKSVGFFSGTFFEGCRCSLLNSYVEQFVWRKEFGGSDCMFNIWKQVAEMFPVEK
jgi:hypothetical protein